MQCVNLRLALERRLACEFEQGWYAAPEALHYSLALAAGRILCQTVMWASGQRGLTSKLYSG
jgi:hypothetical protein